MVVLIYTFSGKISIWQRNSRLWVIDTIIQTQAFQNNKPGHKPVLWSNLVEVNFFREISFSINMSTTNRQNECLKQIKTKMESTAPAVISNFPPDGIFSLRESATFGKYDNCNQLNLMTKYWAVSFGYIWTYYEKRLKQWRLKLD